LLIGSIPRLPGECWNKYGLMGEIFNRSDITLANWRLHPFSRYAFQHVSEFVPVAEITPALHTEPRSPGLSALAGLTLRDKDGSAVDVLNHMRRSYTDHLVVMRDGEVIAEWLADNAATHRPHVIFSISKSVTGMLAGIAANEGVLDPGEAIETYVPLVRGSTYETATVRDLLDMTVDLDFDEEYLDAGGAFDRYRRAMLWNPERKDSDPENMEGFLATLGAQGHGHGSRFYYASPNTDLLGLVIERATGVRYHRYLAEKLWTPMGARGASYVTVDRVGTARAAGGVCITTRDLARLGQLVLDNGRTKYGLQVIPSAWIRDMHENGNRQAWVDGNFSDMFENGRYRSCWYDVGDGSGSFAGVGIHGQWLWCDPISQIVIAKTASRPDPSDDDATALEILMLGQIARAYETL
jgi:CubicO group peptidase (beta-lactamase class C family)